MPNCQNWNTKLTMQRCLVYRLEHSQPVTVKCQCSYGSINTKSLKTWFVIDSIESHYSWTMENSIEREKRPELPCFMGGKKVWATLWVEASQRLRIFLCYSPVSQLHSINAAWCLAKGKRRDGGVATSSKNGHLLLYSLEKWWRWTIPISQLTWLTRVY